MHAALTRPRLRLRRPRTLADRLGRQARRIHSTAGPLTYRVNDGGETRTRELHHTIMKSVHYQVRFRWLPRDLGRLREAFDAQLGRLGQRLDHEIEDLRETVALWATHLLERGGAEPEPGNRLSGPSRLALRRLLHTGTPSPGRIRRLVHEASRTRQVRPRSTTQAPMILAMPERGPSERDDRGRSIKPLIQLLSQAAGKPRVARLVRRLFLREEDEPVTETAVARARSRFSSGVLQLRIEPPEAARALGMAPSGAFDFSYRRDRPADAPSAEKARERHSQTTSRDSRQQARMEVSVPVEDIATLSQETRESLKRELFRDLPPRQLDHLARRVYTVIERRLAAERDRMGRR